MSTITEPNVAGSAAAAAAAQLAALSTAVDDVVTPVVVATFIACLLYGVLLYMAATYFMRFGSSDRLVFKVLVGFLTLSALGDTINDCAWAWLTTVTALLDPSVLGRVPVEFVVYACFTGPNVFLAQGFFTWRVWIISERRNWWLPSFMLLLELAAFALALYLAYWGTTVTLLTEFARINNVMYAWLSVSLHCDLLITFGTVYYLLIRPRRIAGNTPVSSLSSPIGRLVVKTFQTNAASLAVQVLVLVVIVTKGTTLWYTVPGFLESKVYVISVIATLNARKSLSPNSSGDSYAHHSRFAASNKHRAGPSFDHNAQLSVPVHAHISEDAQIDEDRSTKELPFGSLETAYAVRFDRASMNDENDVEVGRKA